MSDAMCVAIDTGCKPHIVLKTKKGSLACDDRYLAWKSNKFYSHVPAVAEEWKSLDEFLTWYKRMKITGNYTDVCTYNQPKGVGKKPCSAKRKVHPSTRNLTLKVL